MTSGNRELLPSITDTLRELALPEADSAASQLIVRYAQQLDDSLWAERAADRVLKHVEDDDDLDEERRADLLDEVKALRNKLAARIAVADLGPKLLVALESVGATPMSRAKIAKLVPPTKAAPTSAAALAMARLTAVPSA